jgi:predicted metal-binding membrane protein
VILARVKTGPFLTAALVLGGALAAWVVAIRQMRGMDGGPGTDLGTLGWYVGVWVTMMAAMMLPSALPMVLLFDRVAGERARRHVPGVATSLFVAGYLAVWTLYGLAAYGVYRIVAGLHLDVLTWSRAGPYLTGALIVVAGAYELTPLKDVCLRHCRSPLHYVFGGWKSGRLGAIRMGAGHGSYCLGCCAGLMLLLFALGVMSLFWMALVAALIFAQKLLPGGERLRYTFAPAFAALGIAVALWPARVPHLTPPGKPGQMQMQMGIAAMRRTPTLIKVMTAQGPNKRHPHPPPGDAGDTFDSSLILFNLGPQFGKPAKKMVGSMRFSYTLRKVCSGFTSKCSATADFETTTTLPGGTIVAGGRGISIAKPTITVPVTGGTGRYAGARGTVTMGPLSTETNVYRLTLP